MNVVEVQMAVVIADVVVALPAPHLVNALQIAPHAVDVAAVAVGIVFFGRARALIVVPWQVVGPYRIGTVEGWALEGRRQLLVHKGHSGGTFGQVVALVGT